MNVFLLVAYYGDGFPIMVMPSWPSFVSTIDVVLSCWFRPSESALVHLPGYLLLDLRLADPSMYSSSKCKCKCPHGLKPYTCQPFSSVAAARRRVPCFQSNRACRTSETASVREIASSCCSTSRCRTSASLSSSSSLRTRFACRYCLGLLFVDAVGVLVVRFLMVHLHAFGRYAGSVACGWFSHKLVTWCQLGDY